MQVIKGGAQRQPREPDYLKCIEFKQPLPPDAPRVAIIEAFVGKNGCKVPHSKFRWPVRTTTVIDVKRSRLNMWLVSADNVPYCWVLADLKLRKVIATVKELIFIDYARLDDLWYMRFSGSLVKIGDIELVKLS